MMLDKPYVLLTYEMYSEFMYNTQDLKSEDAWLALKQLTMIRESMGEVLEKVRELQEDYERAREFFASRGVLMGEHQ